MTLDTDEEIRELFNLANIAVVGFSSTPGKDAHEIPKYLAEQGYNIIPVNPNSDQILGEKAYDSLSEVDQKVDIVEIFRPSGEVPGIVDEALDRRDVQAIWMQLGIKNEEAARKAENAGLKVVQNKCMKVEHRRLVS